MKKLKIFGFLAVMGLIAFVAGVESAPSGPSEGDLKFLLNSPSTEGLRRARLGDLVLDKKVRVLRAHWDFALQGGNSTAPIRMRDLDKVGDAVLPAKAIVKRVYIDTLTQPTTGSGSTATLSVGLTGGLTTTDVGNATSLVAATNAANYGTGGVILDGAPLGTSATMFKLQVPAGSTLHTNGSTVTINAATNSVTGGKLNVYIEFFTADE